MDEKYSRFDEQPQQAEQSPEIQPEPLPLADTCLENDANDTPVEDIRADDSQEPKNETTEAIEEASESESVPKEDPVASDENGPIPQESAAAQTEDNTPQENTVSIATVMEKKPYHERFYLRYGEGKRTDPLDIAGTKHFLNELGFDGGELSQARKGRKLAEDFASSEEGKSNQMYCSYCGTQIAGVEFHRLQDGRLRCTSCSNTLVKTREEVEQIYSRVIANLDKFFGATIDVPVAIEVLHEHKLKKKIGVPIGTRDEQSTLILGVAINKKKNYSILLENGAPRISLIATFAHELTHIWQYTHWDIRKDMPKCAPSKRLLLYEGMAKWAEIQYLYLIGEVSVARREERKTRARQDEYGIGFCLYEQQYPLTREAMSCDETPFTPNRYPLD